MIDGEGAGAWFEPGPDPTLEPWAMASLVRTEYISTPSKLEVGKRR